MKTEKSDNEERANGNKTIWVFTPSRTEPADLEFILVQRHKLLQDAVERVRESAVTANKHHLLFVGPRGCGKTHLVTLIVSRLNDNVELKERLRIAWLNEDESCTTLLELLFKIHAALAKRYSDEYHEDALNEAYELKPEAALEFVSKHLLTTLGSRTLLVVVENLDAIFDGLGTPGQQQLRAFIQEHPQLAVVATAQRLVEDLSDRASPFFGFFQTEHLKPLNVTEATELLQNIARLQEKSDVVEFLATGQGHARIRALHHLSGGNHRIYIVLSQFITRDSIETLLGLFMKMVDELTPYYQERIRWLPPLQRKIVEFLCGCETTVPVKDITKRLFSTPQAISNQLQDLREKGYVEANQRGRESLYEISEPLMRICVEVKDNQGHQPLRLLVDFLRVWYDDPELKHRLGKMEPASVSCAYLESAILRNSIEGNLRKQIILKDLQFSLPEMMTPSAKEGLVRKLIDQPEVIVLAMTSWYEGNKMEALECLDNAIAEESAPSGKSILLLTRAVFYSVAGEWQNALEEFTTVIGLPGVPVETIARTLICRGIAQEKLGETSLAIGDYTAAIGLAGARVVQVAVALVNRGVIFGRAGETSREVADYTSVIGLSGAPVEQVAKALFNRGIARWRQGETPLAIADLTAVIRLPGAPVDPVAMALVNRGVARARAGDIENAIDDYTAVINLPDAPVDPVAKAFVNRGIARGRAGETQAAVADYTSVIGLHGAPKEEVAMALFYRGLIHRQEGRTQAAIADYTATIGQSGVSVDLVAKALVNRGFTQLQAGEMQHAIADYTMVIGLSGPSSEQVGWALSLRGHMFFDTSRHQEAQSDFEALLRLPEVSIKLVVDSYLSLSELQFSDGKWLEGFASLEAGLERGTKSRPPYHTVAVDLIGVMFSAGLSPEGRHDKVNQLLATYRRHDALPMLGEALVQHIGQVFRAGDPFPSTDNLEAWAMAWEQAAESVPEFRLSVRLLRTGVNFVKAGGKDRGILLDLTSTERSILEQALGLEEKMPT